MEDKIQTVTQQASDKKIDSDAGKTGAQQAKSHMDELSALRDMLIMDNNLSEEDATLYAEAVDEKAAQIDSLKLSGPMLHAALSLIADLRRPLLHAGYGRVAGSGMKPGEYFYERHDEPEDLSQKNPYTIYNRITDDEKRDVDSLMQDLLNPKLLGKVAQPAPSPQEAANNLGLEVKDVERAYGLLSSIHDDILDGDSVEYITVNLDKSVVDKPANKKEDENEEGESINTGATTSGDSTNKYIGRVRKDSDDLILSIVLDVVPPQYGNAIYIMRGDGGRFDKDGSDLDLTSKVAIRSTGARRVYHVNSESSVLDRVHKALKMPFDDFFDDNTKM